MFIAGGPQKIMGHAKQLSRQQIGQGRDAAGLQVVVKGRMGLIAQDIAGQVFGGQLDSLIKSFFQDPGV